MHAVSPQNKCNLSQSFIKNSKMTYLQRKKSTNKYKSKITYQLSPAIKGFKTDVIHKENRIKNEQKR